MSNRTKIKDKKLKFQRHYSKIEPWQNVSDKEWNDWKWQFKNRIKTVEQLEKVIKLSEKTKKNINKVLKELKMAITPYYSTLINPTDPDDPIRRQSVPTINELKSYPYEEIDSVMEEDYIQNKSVIHRYPTKIAFLANEVCPSLCRHCTRRRLLVAKDYKEETQPGHIKELIEYLKEHEEVRDVLITGGDALSFSNDVLDDLLKNLYSLEHVEMVRLGTRYPVTLPQRITDDLVQILGQYEPLYVMIQLNHPREITPEFKLACKKLADSGIVLGNQAVLLKGVNDDVQLQKRMYELLLQNRVWPYYLYQCDLSSGMHHFRTPIEMGLKIIEGLIGHTSGPAVPTYIVEAPGGGGKVPLHPNTHMSSASSNKICLKNFEDKYFSYIEPQEYR